MEESRALILESNLSRLKLPGPGTSCSHPSLGNTQSALSSSYILLYSTLSSGLEYRSYSPSCSSSYLSSGSFLPPTDLGRPPPSGEHVALHCDEDFYWMGKGECFSSGQVLSI